ncbi:MAG: hypothetical protein ACREN8_01165 [Candidatus Dormibacteraceae bacterium]
MVEDVYTLPVGSSQYPPMNRYAAAVKQFADIEWGSKIPGLMAKLGLAHIGVETKPRLLGLGGVPDELWRLNLKQVGIQSTLQIFEAVLRV